MVPPRAPSFFAPHGLRAPGLPPGEARLRRRQPAGFATAALRFVGRLGTKTTVFVRTDKPVEGVTLDEDEQRLLDAANGKRTLYDLINTPPLPAGMNARIIYAFVALELLAAKAQKRVKVRIRTEGDSYSS